MPTKSRLVLGFHPILLPGVLVAVALYQSHSLGEILTDRALLASAALCAAGLGLVLRANLMPTRARLGAFVGCLLVTFLVYAARGTTASLDVAAFGVVLAATSVVALEGPLRTKLTENGQGPGAGNV